MQTPIFKSSIFSGNFKPNLSHALALMVFFAGVGAVGADTSAQAAPPALPYYPQVSNLQDCINKAGTAGNNYQASYQDYKTKAGTDALPEMDWCIKKFPDSSADTPEKKCKEAEREYKTDSKDERRSAKDDAKEKAKDVKETKNSIQTELEKAAEKVTTIQEDLQKADADFKEQQAKLAEESQKAELDLASQKRAAEASLADLNVKLVQADGQLKSEQSNLTMVTQAASASMIQNQCNVSVRDNAKKSGINIGGTGNATQAQNLDNMWKDCVNLASTQANANINSAQSKVNVVKAGIDALTKQIQATKQSITDMDLQAQKAAALRAQRMTDLQASYTQKKTNLQNSLMRAQANSQNKIAQANQDLRMQMFNPILGAASGSSTEKVDNTAYIEACCDKGFKNYETKCQKVRDDDNGGNPIKDTSFAAIQYLLMGRTQ